MDRNSIVSANIRACILSLSARRAWIEICRACCSGWLLAVALRKESVDRNNICNPATTLPSVALRKESVDRNLLPKSVTARDTVALRKESVDRNAAKMKVGGIDVSSLSARRAWIEIGAGDGHAGQVVGRSPQGERG